MNGVHDMGGMDGFGKVEPEPNEPMFHTEWEARVLAMVRAMGAAGAAVGTERDLAAALADALRRPGPTVIDASVDPACYPAVMDLSRGLDGRRSVPGTAGRTAKEHT